MTPGTTRESRRPVARRHGLPRLGAHIPGWGLRAAFFIVGLGLVVAEGPAQAWTVVAAIAAAVAVVRPRWMTAWVVIAVLAGTMLARDPSPADWHPYVAIAGVHLTHLLASWMLVAAPRSTIQLRALRPTVIRFVVIQVPVQLVAVVALTVASLRNGGQLPAAAVVAACALLVLAVALLAPLLREWRS